MAEKVTDMLLKVDLNCYSCTKKLKKILCKFPQIRDTVYDEKNNTVKITVVCCSPEKIRDKLCCRGGKVIKTIEILEPSKPKPKKVEEKKETDKPAKEPEKPTQQKEAPKPIVVEKPKDNGKPKSNGKPPAQEKPNEAAPPTAKPHQPAPVAAVPVPVVMMPPKQPEPVPNVPAPTMMGATPCPMQFYSCGQCSGGPCCHGYGMPVAPPPCYDNYGNVYGYVYGPVGGGGGGGGGYYGYNNQRCSLDRCCDYYFSEENPSSCAIM